LARGAECGRAVRHAPQEPVMKMPPLARSAVAATVVLCVPGLLCAKLTPAEDKVYAGIYSNACADRSQPMVRLYGDEMSVERTDTLVAAKPLRASKDHLACIGEVKGSGTVRFGGKAGVEQLTELRWITLQTAPRHYPF
jgi:hypothetical protein